MFACKKLEETLCLPYFSVKKSTKSQQGGLTPSSLQTSCTRELTNARSALVGVAETGEEIYKRGKLTHTRSVCVGVAETGGKPSYMTFGILRLGDAVQRWLRHPEPSSWSYKSTIKEKLLYDSSRANDVRPYLRAKDPVNSQNKRYMSNPLFLLLMPPQKKKLSKRKRRNRDFALCGARRGLRVLDLASL